MDDPVGSALQFLAAPCERRIEVYVARLAADDPLARQPGTESAHTEHMDNHVASRPSVSMDTGAAPGGRGRAVRPGCRSRTGGGAAGCRTIRVKGNTKVMRHLMFGLLILTVDQMMRLLQ